MVTFYWGSPAFSQLTKIGWPGTTWSTPSMQTLIFYNSDQSANRVYIERLLNAYYNIYPQQLGNRLLNYYPDAAAAYDLQLLDEFYTGAAINVRRGMDNATLDVGFYLNELDTAALEAFCNPNTVVYQSDFTAGNEDLSEFNGTGTDGETIAGVSDCYKFELTNGSSTHQTLIIVPEDNAKYSMTFDYYIPSTNAKIDGITITPALGGGSHKVNVTDQWTTATLDLEVPDGNLPRVRIFPTQGSTYVGIDADGDVFYLKNITITQLTSNGYVTVWYDQSGNGNDATQTVSSSQPKIVNNGSVLLKNGKPSIDFGGTGYLETVDTTVDLNIEQIQMVAYNDIQITSTTSMQQILKTYGAAGYEGIALGLATGSLTNETFTIFNDTAARDAITNTIDIDLHLFTADWDGSKHNIYLDGVLGSYISTGTPVQLNSRQITIGSRSGSFNFFGSVSCFVAYSSDQSANRTGIEQIINNNYNIY